MITAHILPDHLTHHEAACRAVQAGLHLVIIFRTGQTALVPQLLPGMVRICSCDKQLEEAA